jgi:hypothetical protein
MATDDPDRTELTAGGGIGGFADLDHARAAIRDAMLDPINRARLRAMLASELGSTDIGRMRDHEVVDQVAWRMMSGSFQLTRIPLAPAPVGGAVIQKEEEESGPSAPLEDRSTWIAIQLIDAEDQPIPDVGYRLAMPNGNVRNGRLNGEGKARVVLSQGGACQVCFPELDQDAWVPVV